ncbi:MAG: amidohydrolase family protein [Pseudohaliea sp.]
MKLLPLFDSHLHIIDPRFPVVENAGYLPPSFTVPDYLARTAAWPLVGGAVVSGSFQAFDQSYLVAALRELGEGFVGVTQLPAAVTDDEVLALAAAGVRGVRFNLRRGGSAAVADLQSMAARFHELAGWHVELYVDAAELGPMRHTLLELPAVCIDHLGLSRAGFPLLLALVERGVHVKATGFGRVDFPVEAALREIHAVNPEALMFGSDLPSTRAPRPFAASDIDRVGEALGDAGARAVLCDNARAFYRVPGSDA